ASVVRESLREIGADRRQLSLGGGQGAPGTHTANDREEPRGSAFLAVERQRRPDVHAPIRELEIGGHDPDDGVVHAVELEALTDDGGVGGEAPAPESVTEDDGRRASVLSFLIEEPAARRRAHTHDVEERWRDAGAIDALRAVAGQHVVA